MPAETHQHGRTSDAAAVGALLCLLLGGAEEVTERTVLADLGLDATDLDDLWDAVRDELADRTVAPELDPGDLDPRMTVAEAARIMASLLGGATQEDDDA